MLIISEKLSRVIDAVLRSQTHPVSPSYLADEINRITGRFVKTSQINRWASHNQRGQAAVRERLLAKRLHRVAPAWWKKDMPVVDDVELAQSRSRSFNIQRTGDLTYDRHITVSEDNLSAIHTQTKRDAKRVDSVATSIDAMADMNQRNLKEIRTQDRLIEVYRVLLKTAGIKPDDVLLPSS